MTLIKRLTKAVNSRSQEYDAGLYAEARDEILRLEVEVTLTGRRLDNQTYLVRDQKRTILRLRLDEATQWHDWDEVTRLEAELADEYPRDQFIGLIQGGADDE